jgi:hypothetical protein
MDTINSAQFRKQYHGLLRPTLVTVNGHPIGQWVPISTAIDSRALDAIRPGEPTNADGSFNTRPFTPVPKHRK